jgi:tetratricopeptide (TPR) repeat protein
MLNTKLRLFLGVSVGFALALPTALHAEQYTSARVVLPATPVAASQAEPSGIQVDESALYYYAQNNQHDRVDAEVRRLRALHPLWNPPADLYHGGAYNRDQGLWDMLAANEIAEIHAEIAQRTALEPGWQPPLELVHALERVEVRRQLLADHGAGRSHAIIAAVEEEPALLDGDDLEVLWVAGTAYANEQNRDIAAQLFDVAMRGVRSSQELRGTLYNARDALPTGDVETLLATGVSLHSNQPEYAEVFDTFALDLHRDRLGSDLEIWRVDPNRAHALNRDAMAAIENSWANHPHVRGNEAELAGDYELVGWAYYALGDHTSALHLFRRALETPERLRAGTAARYGAALCLREMGDAEGALELLAAGLPSASDAPALIDVRYQSQPASNHARDDRPVALYIELLSNAFYGLEDAITLTPERVARHSHYVGMLESAKGAEALGWYAYRSDQIAPAAAWFEKSLEWRPSASAVEGLVRSTWRLGERTQALALVESYQSRFEDLASLGASLERSRAAPRPQTRTAAAPSSNLSAASQAQRAGNPRRCLNLLQSAPHTHQVNLIRGWCLLDLNRSHEAAVAFEAVARGASGATKRDAGYGHALAMLRQGRTFDALAVARDTDLSEEQRGVIARSALADQANQAFNAGHYADALAALDRRLRFAAEPRDLSLLRAWSMLRLNATGEARALFITLDRQLSTRETQRGLAALPQSHTAPFFGDR